MKTTNLRLPELPRHWYDLSTPAAAVICILALLAIAALVGIVRSAATPEPTVIFMKPAILIQTAPPAPTLTPAPTPEPVIQFVYLAAPTPITIYVETPPVTSQEAPGAPEAMPQALEVAPAPADERAPVVQIEQPTDAPIFGDAVTQEWGRVQVLSEDCIGTCQ